MSALIDPLLERQRQLQRQRESTPQPGDSYRPENPDDPETVVTQRSDSHGKARTRERLSGLGLVIRSRLRASWRQIAVGVAALLVPVLYSYTIALTGPGTDSFQARTVEWGRDHHFGPVVDRVEQWYYSNHQAAVGGVPSPPALDALTGSVAKPAAANTTTNTASTANIGISGTSTAVVPQPSPATAPVSGVLAPLRSPAAVPVDGEGTWAPLSPKANGGVGAYVTAIRPDDVHTSSLDAVVNFDPKYFRFRAYPGTKIPKPWDRPDYVEAQRQPSLVAAFSGGFRLRDSGGGMILGGTVIQPMRNGVATMSIDKKGVANVGVWGRDMSDSSALDSARQNLDLIVDNGIATPDLLTDPNRKWGFTGPKNNSAVWRSGAGITADGHLVWVGGPGMTIEALAQTLIRAGAIRGMQLEINQEWVQLNTYTTSSAGYTSGKRLLNGMAHTGNRWLTEDTRDFVAAFVRNP